MSAKQTINTCVPCHLTSDSAFAVKNLAFSKNQSASEWLRQLVEKELSRELLQAQATLMALGSIANGENGENAANGENDYDL